MPRAKSEERKTKERGNGQGTVWKLKDGRWRWQITVGHRADGKRIPKGGVEATKKAAHDAMTKALADLSRGLLGASEKITVEEYADRWLRRHLETRPNTVKRYREELAYALSHIGKMRLQDVRAQHLKDLMVTLAARQMKRGGTMSTRTQAHVLTRLRSLFREAVSDQIIYVNPVEGVKRVKAPRAESIGVALDFEQTARLHTIGWALYEAGLCRLWPALFTAVSIGLRRSEVMGLTWEHVDLTRGILRVRQARTVGVKGVEMGEPKTANSKRDIPMPQSLVVALRRHQETQQEEKRVAGRAWVETGAVFADELGDWIHPNRLNPVLRSVLKWSDPKAEALLDRRGVPRKVREQVRAAVVSGTRLPDISPHDLRHTYATLALHSGVPVEVVSKVLGHSRVSMTLDVYRHVLDNEKRAVAVDLFAAMPKSQPVAVPVLN